MKWALKHCIVCKRMERKSYSVPVPPPLPVVRENPFSVTGVDFAGPLIVKGEDDKKVWICLFMCCITRAVHLDIVNNLSVDFFLRSFHRFISRRGLPRRMISDNAKTFKGASNVLTKIMNHPQVKLYFMNLKIVWTFNAPWWGGIFVQLVQSVKQCLRKTIGISLLSCEELLTLVIDVEMIFNSHPLTMSSENDIEEPVTLSHLIYGYRLMSQPDHLC